VDHGLFQFFIVADFWYTHSNDREYQRRRGFLFCRPQATTTHLAPKNLGLGSLRFSQKNLGFWFRYGNRHSTSYS